jgi:2-polyprenyl-3-methyl-5-hydroxy-6-metoxy-1,4-benzoquinol methylase
MPPNKLETAVDAASFTARYFPPGGLHTDLAYLHGHFPRYHETLARYLAGHTAGGHVLDIGAHWLHQSLMWRDAGFRVTALELAATFALPAIRALAEREGIALAGYESLESPAAIANVADEQVDVVLFCEILEHITFNPVTFWREVYRVLKPGGTIVLTTPNYYRLRGKAWRWLRFAAGGGAGAGVGEILATPTFGTHWKEYSRREVVDYFARLSPDFAVSAAYARHTWGGPQRHPGLGAVLRTVEVALPPLRPGLHVEVTLKEKRAGIVIEPGWRLET